MLQPQQQQNSPKPTKLLFTFQQQQSQILHLHIFFNYIRKRIHKIQVANCQKCFLQIYLAMLRSLWGLKILSCFVIFLQVTIFAFLPYRYQQLVTNKHINTLIGCFTAGLFLGTSLLHILPQSNQQIQAALEHNKRAVSGHSHDTPYGSLICILTIIFLLGIENYFGEEDHTREEQTKKRKNNHMKQGELKTKKGKSSQSKIILTQIALGIHSFFECMSLGIQKQFGTALTLFVGIIIHKWAEGLTLGYAYKNADIPQQTALKYIALYAIMNTIAVLLGWKLSSENPLTSGILNSVSAGTFLFIALVEKIKQDFNGKELLPLKLLALSSGVIFVSRNWKHIEDYVIIEKKTMELETLNQNLQRQLRLHEENQAKRKAQLENLILINNRLTLDNAALKKEIDQFRQQGNELIDDLNTVKKLYETICRKVELMGEENQKLHQQIAKQRIDIDRYLDDIAFAKREADQMARKNQHLTMTMRHIKSSHKREELSLLEQSVNERVSNIYNMDKSIETQQELKQRIQLLEQAIEKQSKMAPQTNRHKKQFIMRQQRLHGYFMELKKRVCRKMNSQKNVEKLEKFVSSVLEQITSCLEREITEARQ